MSDPGVSQILAENFVVSGSPIQVDELVLWGFYWTTNNVGTDNFHVRFMVDAGGLPGGDVAPQEVNVPSAKFDTGIDFAGMDEYQFTLSLVSPVSLDPGTYWVEIYNEVGGTPDSFCWEGGALDPTNGIMNAAFAREAPGVSWASGPWDLSLELNGVVIPVELESFEIEK